MNEHETKGKAKEVGGNLKEAAGDAVGNGRLKTEGQADQAEGKTEKNYGKVKDAVNDATR